jgi:hypothetical protein
VDFIRYVTGLAIFLSTSFMVVVCAHLVLRRHTKRKEPASSGREE